MNFIWTLETLFNAFAGEKEIGEPRFSETTESTIRFGPGEYHQALKHLSDPKNTRGGVTFGHRVFFRERAGADDLGAAVLETEDEQESREGRRMIITFGTLLIALALTWAVVVGLGF